VTVLEGLRSEKRDQEREREKERYERIEWNETSRGDGKERVIEMGKSKD
jgi:hypothetical protein